MSKEKNMGMSVGKFNYFGLVAVQDGLVSVCMQLEDICTNNFTDFNETRQLLLLRKRHHFNVTPTVKILILHRDEHALQLSENNTVITVM